ncbi:MAG: hypothetical protein MK212_22565, partial [Saprospiraceae bacterium]|nr:hypothetical protein [Saprospiraceae bacterium]
IGFGAVVFWHKKQLAAQNIDQSITKKQQAGHEATKRLTTAKSMMQANQGKAFYDELSKVLMGYVSDKFNIPLSELSKANVKVKLETNQVNRTEIERFTELLQTCEMALFAGMINTSAMQETYKNTNNWINTIENQLT